MAKRQISPLVSDRVRLRLLEEADLPMTLAWRNQDHIRQWFVHSAVLTWEQHHNWCGQYFQRDDDFIFIIEDRQQANRPIGQISLYNIEWPQRRAEYGRLMIGEASAAGKGFAKEATQVLLDYAFHSLKLTEVHLEVFTHNVSAIAIYHGCGFQEVGEQNGLKKMSIRVAENSIGS
jgi:diamine N-acetyltransferase